jgi:hypothetical protein
MPAIVITALLNRLKPSIGTEAQLDAAMIPVSVKVVAA